MENTMMSQCLLLTIALYGKWSVAYITDTFEKVKKYHSIALKGSVAVKWVAAPKLCSIYAVLYSYDLRSRKLQEGIQRHQVLFYSGQQVTYDVDYTYFSKI